MYPINLPFGGSQIIIIWLQSLVFDYQSQGFDKKKTFGTIF